MAPIILMRYSSRNHEAYVMDCEGVDLDDAEECVGQSTWCPRRSGDPDRADYESAREGQAMIGELGFDYRLMVPTTSTTPRLYSTTTSPPRHLTNPRPHCPTIHGPSSGHHVGLRFQGGP